MIVCSFLNVRNDGAESGDDGALRDKSTEGSGT
jgi:hypothetical protein